jgi:hypothetical protein
VNNQRQLVREWLASSPGTFEDTSVQRCFIAAHNASGLPMQICEFRGELEALGLSIRRSGSTSAEYRLTLSSEITP